MNKDIKIAIHHHPNSFSDRWLEYCEKKGVNYKLVDCTKTDIIEQLKDCDGLMWHWGQTDYRLQLFAKQLTLSLEKMGKRVFPNSGTCWHFDDKVGQKYLFEAINGPLVRSNVFYTKKNALKWIKQVSFPKVFKLRGGAASANVELVRNVSQAKHKVKIAFGKGFPAYKRSRNVREKFRKLLVKKDKKSLINFIKSLTRVIFPNKKMNLLSRQKGYVYFQDFIPDNNYDTRINMIGDKCFGVRRYVRNNDFRASGSGQIDNDPELIDLNIVKIAFDIAEKLGTQSLAFDFVMNKNEIKVIEISYAFPLYASDDVLGYWDRNLDWHEGPFNPQEWIIENFIHSINTKTN